MRLIIRVKPRKGWANRKPVAVVGKNRRQKQGKSAARRQIKTLTRPLFIVLNKLFALTALARRLKALLLRLPGRSAGLKKTRQKARIRPELCGADPARF